MVKTCIVLSILATSIAAVTQQPQTQTAPIYSANSKYVQGIGIGYWPTPATGLTLHVASGTAFCLGSVVTYAGGTLTMTASTTNYVYLNVASSCVPAVKTTAFQEPDVPLAVVTASGSAITGVTDDRVMFTALPVAAFGTNNLILGTGSALASPSDTNETVIGSGLTGNGTKSVTVGDAAKDLFFQIEGAALILDNSTSSAAIDNLAGDLNIFGQNKLTLQAQNGQAILDGSSSVKIVSEENAGVYFCLNGDGCFIFNGDNPGSDVTYTMQNASGTLDLTVAVGTPTFTKGTNTTSCGCASGYTCSNQRGEITIVGGTATTGTICTVNFSATLAAAPGFAQVTQNGGAVRFGIGHGIPSTASFTVTADVSVASSTVNVDYNVIP